MMFTHKADTVNVCLVLVALASYRRWFIIKHIRTPNTQMLFVVWTKLALVAQLSIVLWVTQLVACARHEPGISGEAQFVAVRTNGLEYCIEDEYGIVDKKTQRQHNGTLLKLHTRARGGPMIKCKRTMLLGFAMQGPSGHGRLGGVWHSN